MWRVNVAGPAAKALKRVPSDDRDRIVAALDAMAADPFSGDVRKLDAGTFRCRVGNYRIVFEVHTALRFVQVTAIVRRTSVDYWRR